MVMGRFLAFATNQEEYLFPFFPTSITSPSEAILLDWLPPTWHIRWCSFPTAPPPCALDTEFLSVIVIVASPARRYRLCAFLVGVVLGR